MKTIDPTSLPYPWPDGVPRAVMGPTNEVVQAPNSLTLGNALGYRTVQGREWKPQEGLLALSQSGFTFYIGDGTYATPVWDVGYEDLASFKLKRSRLPGSRLGEIHLWKLSLRGKDGSKFYFRIGDEMAANADYILGLALGGDSEAQ
jgi:hypothetical protein